MTMKADDSIGDGEGETCGHTAQHGLCLCPVPMETTLYTYTQTLLNHDLPSLQNTENYSMKTLRFFIFFRVGKFSFIFFTVLFHLHIKG